MLNQILKKKIQPFVPLKFFQFLYRIKITPNVLTAAALVFGAIAFYFFFNGKVVLGGIFVLLSYLFDVLDGTEARLLNLNTKFGAFFDFLGDRIIRFSWYLALVESGKLSAQLALWIVALEAVSHILFLLVSWQDLKHIRWMPFVVVLLVVGAPINRVTELLNIELYLGSAILVINFISILYLNYNEKTKQTLSSN